MQKKNSIKIIIFMFLCCFITFISINFPYELLMILNNQCITSEEFNKLMANNNFFISKIAKVSNDDKKIDDNDIKEYVIKYNLFNLINVKNLKVKVTNVDAVFAGGDCVGISLKSRGAMLVGGNYIITKEGAANPIKNSGLEFGDIIIAINDNEITSVNDIIEYLNSSMGETLKITVNRLNKKLDFEITPALDIQTNKYKLGLWLKDETLGVGTLTYINASADRFGALGHAIGLGENTNGFDIVSGRIYDCRVVGVKQGNGNTAGQLLGLFNANSEIYGNIDKNNENGIYGTIINYGDIIENKNPIEVGGRLTAKPGKAKILSCINGKDIEEFDIEIIKTNFQKSATEKSMIIRITDSDLIAKTGGIVQGMSGSPIIQNGKLVGAVTHVFLNDATKGFGLYIDWMINQ